MSYTKESLLKERVFYYFDQLCQIPHGTRNEKAISDFVLGWARELGLEAMQDSVNNVFIQKKAYPGYENAPGIMLQAHLDMVCEKAPDSPHDFETDPIHWCIEDDLITTGGQTTLGADDGVGVALAMAVLENSSLPHPKLEVLFTVCEEDDFTGISNFDTDLMHSRYLINLDNAGNDQIMCGSCGGIQVDWVMPVSRKSVPNHWCSYRLNILGLKGGHSGEDIHRGRGSANQLLGRALLAIQNCGTFLVSQMEGGTFRLAIPREAQALIAFAPEMLPAVQSALAALEQDARHELALTADQVHITLEPADQASDGVASRSLVSAITLMPDGILQMNEALTGLVDTSDNMGEIRLNRDDLHMVIEVRSARASLGQYLAQRMQQLADLLGADCSTSNIYPSWDYLPNSQLQKIAGETYRSLFHSEPRYLTIHAGLEVGCFFPSKPDLDAIAIGPDCWSFHSPNECLSIPATLEIYRYLCKILENIH